MAKLQNVFSWSPSRDNQFKECKRAYYYQYYGSWGGWEAQADAKTKRLYLLKNLQSLPIWAGSIVHEIIAEALETYSRKKKPIVAAELQSHARTRLRSGWLEAVNRKWIAKPKKTNLEELYYGNGKTLPKEKTDDIKKRIYDCLQAFCDSAILQEIMQVPYLDWKPIDKLDSFNLENIKIWCAVDFAYISSDGILRILDWKTGAEHRDALETQLACYAYYASERWYQPVDKVRLYGVFLKENARISEYRVHDDLLEEAKEKITRSSNEMLDILVNPDENKAREEDFPTTENQYLCGRCNYREICEAVRAPSIMTGDELL